MNYYLLFYRTIEKRAIYRSEHLKMAKDAQQKGSLIMAGAMAEPADGAVLIFKGESSKIAQDFAKNHPYVKNGLIKSWEVRPWTVVVGH